MLTDEQIAERLRQTSYDFCKLEKTHHRLDTELLALLKHHTLTPQEALLKTRLQKEKLDTKDRIAACIRAYRNAQFGTSEP